MAKILGERLLLYCKRCSHRWLPRKQEIRICPQCKSAYWDVAPKTKKLRHG